MDVPTITMDREEAEARLAEYRQGRRRRVARELAAEWQRIEILYGELAKGTPVLDIEQVFHEAPLDERGRPRIAIARADRRQVHFCWEWRSGLMVFNASEETAGHCGPTLRIVVNARREAPHPSTWPQNGYALVPLVPPRAIPVGGRSALRDHFVLWEVEAWADRRIGSQPDRDPFLLRHLDGTLYAVVAQWDLTELERRILARRVER